MVPALVLPAHAPLPPSTPVNPCSRHATIPDAAFPYLLYTAISTSPPAHRSQTINNSSGFLENAESAGTPPRAPFPHDLHPVWFLVRPAIPAFGVSRLRSRVSGFGFKASCFANSLCAPPGLFTTPDRTSAASRRGTFCVDQIYIALAEVDEATASDRRTEVVIRGLGFRV